MPVTAERPHRIHVLKSVFSSPLYILITIVAAIAYYELFKYLVLISNKDVFFITAPVYLIYALILSAAVLMTTSIYAIAKSLRAKYAGAEGGILSIITSSLTGLVIGCSCYAPILASVMYAIGFGTLAVSDAISFVGDYQNWLLVLFIALNLIFIYYQLGRITRIGGVHKRKR